MNIGFKSGLIILVIISIIFVSGCTGSSTSYKNYTNPYMSFQYPAGWNVENDSVGGVNIYNGTADTHDQWIAVNPYGNYGGNVGTMDDFNNALAQASTGTQSPKIQNQTINGIQCTIMDNNPQGDFPTWKYIFFNKNGKGVQVAGLVKDIEVLKHVVSTFN